MTEYAEYPPWNGKQSDDFSKIPWYFPSQEYNKNYINEMRSAFENKEPYSWIRIGDGEIAILQQEYVHSTKDINSKYGWSNYDTYCGVRLPNLDIRDRIIEGIKHSELVGVFKGDPLNEQLFDILQLQPKSICYAFDNIALPMNPQFVQLMIDARILLVGQNSESYAKKFKEIINKDVVGCVSIKNYNELHDCIMNMCKYDFDIALVSAGANAKAICPEMKMFKNAMFLDMGHAWDNAFHPKGKYDEYWLIPTYDFHKSFEANTDLIYDRKLYKCLKSCNGIDIRNNDYFQYLKDI